MLLVGYCYGIRHERRLCQEVVLHLAYRWFCKLDLDDKVPHHSTFSVNMCLAQRYGAFDIDSPPTLFVDVGYGWTSNKNEEDNQWAEDQFTSKK
jgi:hypothetical protein